MSNWSVRRRGKQRRGVSAAEFAITVPLLIALCLVAVDLGRYAYVGIALANAVRVGTEYGAGRGVTEYSYEAWQLEVQKRVNTELEDLTQEQAETLLIEMEVSSFEEDLPRVSVAAQCEFTTVIDWWIFPRQLPIRRSISMARYR